MAFYDTLFIAIKLLFSKDKELYSFCYKQLGFCPRNIYLYKLALRHRSATCKTNSGMFVNNERLEFLGDAVLNLVVADMLYKRFEKGREGFLTNTRSKIVQRETLNKLADKIHLTDHLKYTHPIHSHNCCMGGNALEAFIGAVYLDRGYDICARYIVKKLIIPHINLKKIAKKEVNFKSKLLEWCQKNRIKIEFNLVSTEYDEERNPIFHSVVMLAGLEGGTGTGYTKKESHQNAAKEAYARIDASDNFCETLLERAVASAVENGAVENTEFVEPEEEESVLEEKETLSGNTASETEKE